MVMPLELISRREEKRLRVVIEDLFAQFHVKIVYPYLYFVLFYLLLIFISYNARKEANLQKLSPFGRRIYHELDVWIPALKLGFEYQVYLLLMHTAYFFKIGQAPFCFRMVFQ